MFTTIQQVYDAAPGTISINTHLPALAGSQRQAYAQYLRPYLPQAFYDALSQSSVASNIAAALPYARRALAYFMVYKQSFISGVTHTNHGLQRLTGENADTAYKYQENNYRAELLTAGYTELEELCIFLAKHSPSDPLTTAWGTGADYHRRHLIRTAQQFQRVHQYQLPRYTFEQIRGVLYDIETFILIPLLGPTMTTTLLDYLTDTERTAPTGTASPILAELLLRLQRALAAFTVQEALLRGLVQLVGNTVVQTEALEPQSTHKVSPPTISTLSPLVLGQQEFAQRHLSYVREYLSEVVDEDIMAPYKAYLATLAAAEAAAAEAATPITTTTPGATPLNPDLGTGYRTPATSTKVVRL